MNPKKYIIAFTILNLCIINGIIISFLNLKYPFVGHDYTLAIPSILDSALHFRLNGLTIQWFTPSFGGGIPAFPNPNNGQFSLVVLFSIFLSPWWAVMLSTITYISIGFIASEYFLRTILKFDWTASLLGAVFFSANGFMVERVAVGHLGYFTFPLLPIFLIALLNTSIPSKASGALMGLLVGFLIHFAGYFIIIVFILSILIILPFIYMINQNLLIWKRFFATLAIGGIISVVISLSKLTAVYSFMRFFPRVVSDYYETPFLLGLFGLLLQLLGTMNLLPLFFVAGLNPDTLPNYILAVTGADYGIWEVDMSMTPLVFIILLIGVDLFFHHPKKYITKFYDSKKILALLVFFFALWLTIEFTLAKGLFYPLLQNLPIFSSLHVNPRFAAAFIFPLAIFSAYLFNRWITRYSMPRRLVIYTVANLLAVIPLGTYFLYQQDLIVRLYDIRFAQKIFEDINNEISMDIVAIGITKDNTDALLSRTSNLNLYDPVFGYELEYFHPQIQNGSVWNVSDGKYNMTDPTSYVYPELNNNQLFDRFRVEDKQTLELFVKHIQPKWKIPLYQIILNWISGLSFLFAFLVVIFTILRKNEFDSKRPDSHF